MKRKATVIQYSVLWTILAAVVIILWLMDINTISQGTMAASPSKSPSPSPSVSALTSSENSKTETGEVTKENTGGTDFVGMWVPYYDLQSESADKFKENYQEIIKTAQKAGVTALFVHVRAFGDALYKSDYYPWSHIITGTQGEDPGFDPLEYMIDLTHKAGMEFHAWINPMRIASDTIPSFMSDDNVYTELNESNSYYFIKTDGGIYLNPAYSYVRELISSGAAEIAKNYDVDGIHFDDYFYPPDVGNQDEIAYMAYLDTAVTPLSLEEWRTANISAMVSETYRAIKKANSKVVFGISPQGNIANNASIGADVAEWCSTQGYIDYICPQLYFSYDNAALGFTDALNDWMKLDFHDGLKIYIGLALYKVDTDSDGNTWQNGADIIKRQIQDTKEAKANGVVYFDSGSVSKVFK